MRGMKKSKRVSWPSDNNLCQARLFLSDESPSQVGLGAQDDLQAKSSWVSQPTGVGYDDNLPPGFEGSHPTDLLKNKLSQIPLPKWRSPPRFALEPTWQVAAGEESKEVELQNQREMRILEAVYPRPSAIPPNPIALKDLEASPNYEVNIPLIPITPFEDEETTTVETSTYSMTQNSTTVTSQPVHCTTPNVVTPVSVVPGADPEMVAQAAYAVLNAVATSNSQVDMIDPELLMKILNDPKWHERLLANHGAVTNPNPISTHSQPTVLPPVPPHVQTSRTEIGVPSSMAMPLNGPVYAPSRVVPSSPPPVAKDVNYYKSLIQQHGAGKPEAVAQLNNRQNPNHEWGNNIIQKDLNPKKTKPCMYFNSPRGCRKGSTCPFQHDASSMQSAKRVKLDREITGE